MDAYGRGYHLYASIQSHCDILVPFSASLAYTTMDSDVHLGIQLQSEGLGGEEVVGLQLSSSLSDSTSHTPALDT